MIRSQYLRSFERHAPYCTMASYLPVSATIGEQASAPQSGALPWFRGTWAANGPPLVDGAEPILGNRRFREAASRLFDGAEVMPTTIVINVNAPMPAGAIHVSFRGATRDRYPIQLLQAMGSSGLFEPWRYVEAGAVAWFYEGPGGEFDYWPEGLSAPAQSERQPLSNCALVADNDRIYHRIGWIGEPTPKGSDDLFRRSNRAHSRSGLGDQRRRSRSPAVPRPANPNFDSVEGPR